MKTIELDSKTGAVRIIDQRRLPSELRILVLSTCPQVAESIRNMSVRGAPAIGVAGAFGLALTVARFKGRNPEELCARLEANAQLLSSARPTAVNLSWAIHRMMRSFERSDTVEAIRAKIMTAAQNLAEEDIRTNLKMAEAGAELIEDGDVIIHHCNTGALAAVDWGTALGCIRYAHEHGKRVHVLVDETRPRLQGSRLTAWELERYHIPFEVISDGAAGYFLRKGKASKVMFGADRVTANGDVVNKTGTYMLALAAHDNGKPVVCVFPTSTLDPSKRTGDEVMIEMRPEQEVLSLRVDRKRVFPANAHALNPAFDITPSKLISHMVTEKGIIEPPYEKELKKLAEVELEKVL